MTEKDSTKEKFVFIQVNLWEGRCYYPIINFLNREQPHIFAVQELLTGSNIISPAHMSQEVLIEKQFFNQVSQGKTCFGLARFTASFDKCCATFMRDSAKLIATNHLDLYDTAEHTTVKEKRHNDYAGLLHSVVQLPDNNVIHILNHHEKLMIDGRINNPVAEQSFQKIAEYIAALDGAVILSGDFNLYKQAPALLPLKKIGLKNLNEVYGIESARNELSWKPEECVSHVFVSEHIIAHDYYVAADIISDHQPLVLHFSVDF